MDKWLLKRPQSPCSSTSAKVFKSSEDNVDSSDSSCTQTMPDEPDTDIPTATSSQSSTSSKKVAKRKYDPSYLAFGFTFAGDINEPIPQCVICMEMLSKHSMKPSLLMRHFNTKHGNLKGKPLVYFKNKEIEVKGSKTTMSSFSSLNVRAVEASYKVSLRIAEEGKPHTIGETLILPAAKDIVCSLFGEKEAKKLDVVSLSNSTVSRRIEAMALDVKHFLISKIKNSTYFSIQIDESTDVTNLPNLLCYVRYEDGNEVKEELLFCEPLQAYTTSEDIFMKLNDFMNKHQLDWTKCVGICTDGAAAMTGRHSGVVIKVLKVAPKAKITHCCLHREALVTKRCPENLKVVLSQAVKTVNFIKSRALNSRLFSIMCDDMGSVHRQLLLHTEVRWLSRGKVITRLFELRQEVMIFLSNTEFEFQNCFTDELWLCKLAYLADVFSKLNDLNQSMQGNNMTPFRVKDKINAMKKKLNLAAKETERKQVSFFPTLESFVKDNDLDLSSDFLKEIKTHCLELVCNYDKYFPEDLTPYSWIQNPFNENYISEEFTAKEKEQYLELSCDSELRQTFSKMTLIDFWISRRSDYADIADKAITFLLPFSTSYLCETAFSSLVYLKNKYRNKLLCVENDLRLRLSNIKPDIIKLAASLQPHPSH